MVFIHASSNSFSIISEMLISSMIFTSLLSCISSLMTCSGHEPNVQMPNLHFRHLKTSNYMYIWSSITPTSFFTFSHHSHLHTPHLLFKNFLNFIFHFFKFIFTLFICSIYLLHLFTLFIFYPISPLFYIFHPQKKEAHYRLLKKFLKLNFSFI